MNIRMEQKPTHVVACAMGRAVNEEDRRVMASLCVRPDQVALAEVVLGLLSANVRLISMSVPAGICAGGK